MEDATVWYNDIPICTKFLFTSFVAVTVLGEFFISPQYLFHSLEYTFYKLQLWRLYTSFFCYSFSLGGAFQLYFLYRYSKDIETTRFAGKTADYVFFLLFEALSIIIVGWFFGIIFFNHSLVMAIIYIWSQYYKETEVTFMFGLRFKGVYLPFVLLLFEMLQIRSIPWSSVVGVLTGHLYYYLHDIYPATGGTRFLNTPQWLYNIFPNTTVRTSFGTILNHGRNANVQQTQGRNWGRGFRLG